MLYYNITFKYIYMYYGPGPHWGTVRKKMSYRSRYVSHVYYAV